DTRVRSSGPLPCSRRARDTSPTAGGRGRRVSNFGAGRRRERRRRGYGVRSTTKMSVEPAVVRIAPPKSPVPTNQPVITTLRLPPIATAVPALLPVSAKTRAHTCAPLAPDSFATNAFSIPIEVSAPPPKSIEEVKLPATAMSPALSTATPVAFSQLLGPAGCFAQIYAPSATAYLATKTSLKELVKALPPPKLSPIPYNSPAITTLPQVLPGHCASLAQTTLTFDPP